MSARLKLCASGSPMVRASASLSFSRAFCGHNQLLLQGLVIHPRPQLVQQRRRARLVIGNRLVERNFGRGHLRFHARDLGLIGQHQQIGIAHGQHHQFPRVLRRELRGGKVVARGQVVAQRVHIHQRPAQRSANIGIPKRPDEWWESPECATPPRAGRPAITVSLPLASTEGSSDCNWLSRWPRADAVCVPLRMTPRLVLSPRCDGLVKRQADGLRLKPRPSPRCPGKGSRSVRSVRWAARLPVSAPSPVGSHSLAKNRQPQQQSEGAGRDRSLA